MEDLTNFFNGISDFNVDISSQSKVYFLTTLIIFFVIVSYLLHDNVKYLVLKSGYEWYVAVVLFNLIALTLVIYYYMTKKDSMVGLPGDIGNKGERGKRGKFITCSFCKWNIYAQKTKNYEKVVSFYDTGKLAYSDIVNTILNRKSLAKDLEKKINNLLSHSADLDATYFTTSLKNIYSSYSTIMGPTLLVFYIGSSDINYVINNEEKPGSIYRASGKKGYFPIGDTPFLKDIPTKMNGFVISGDVRHPIKYKKITNVPSLYIDDYATDEYTREFTMEEYSLWSPIAPDGFVALGDIVQFGNKAPDTTNIVCLRNTCVKKISIDDLEFMYLHWGSEIPVTELSKIIKEDINTEKDVSNITKNLHFFSVWRTPLNNTIFNVAKEEDFSDNTLIYNIINGRSDYLDKLGEVEKYVYKRVSNKLKSIELPVSFNSLYISTYFASYYLKQTETYMKRNMKHIEKIKNKGKKKKHVERIFKQLYQDKMSNVVPLIDKTKNLYDLVMILFPDGYKTQIAANESLVNTMGLPLLPIQSNLLKLLKCIFPPNRDVYMIKNDCLSYIKIDEERTKLVKQVQKEIRDSNKYIKIFTSNPDEYCESKQGILLRISQKDDKLSQYLGHINNYQSKLENGEFDDFTNERLNNILTLYQSLNEFLLKDCSIPETD